MKNEFPTQVGPYRLLRRLGAGGMASVHVAEHESGGPLVALKLLSSLAARDSHLVARFLQEAEILERLRIPGVVQVRGSGRHEDTAYLLMDWLQGETLREWMAARAGRVSPREARLIGARLAAILAQVHARGITHRDLKPENIFLCSPEAGDLAARVTLLDFGIAKPPPRRVDALDPTQVHTQDSALLGTYPYMAPEQFRSAARVEPSADVYALGVMLFELLAGRRPFVSEEPVELMSAHVSRPPPSLREFASTAHGGLCAFVTSMLDKEPERRPSMERCHDMLGRAWEELPETCPLPGLAPFTEAHAELFFGRDGEVHALLTLLAELRAGSRRWLQVEGPSGVGKSSLLQAGLVPRLSPALGWHVVSWRPRDEPLAALARALASAGQTAEAVERALRSNAGALRDLAAARLPPRECLLLVVESLEDLFTLGTADGLAVAALLSEALAAPDSPVRLLTSVRTDFLHRLEQAPGLSRHLPSAARYTLPPMGPEALVQVVEGMARQTGLTLSEGLASRMAHDAQGGGLPLLGNALRGLWGLSGGAPLTHEQYRDRLGGLGGALVRQAEALLESLGAPGRERARWMLLSLVQVSRGAPDTCRPRSRGDVLAMAGGDALAEQVLLQLSGSSSGGSGELTGSRLLHLSGGADAAEPRVELMHELLMLRVRSIAGWIEDERTRLELRTALEGAARDWHQAGGPVDDLPTGSLLAYHRRGAVTALGAGAGHRRECPEVERYLQAAQRLERRRALTRGGIAVAGGLAVLLIVFYAVLASRERARAQEAQFQAEASLEQFVAQMNSFSGTSDWHLSWLPFTSDDREAMLKGFRQSLEELPTPLRMKPKVQLAAIRVFQRSSDFAFQDGTLAEADGFLNKAEGELLAPSSVRLDDEELLWLRALQSSKQGKVKLAQGALSEACSHFTQSVEELKRLHSVSDDTEDGRRTLAVSLVEQAECEAALHRWDAAISLLTQAIGLHARNGKSFYNKALLAEALGKRAEIYVQKGQAALAREGFAQALATGQDSLKNAFAGDQYSQWVLARVLLADVAFRLAQGELREAEGENRDALRLGEQLLKGEPRGKRYVLVVLEALGNEARFSPGSGAEALAASCALVRDFHTRDAQDVRFVLTGCPASPSRKESPP